MLLPLKHGISLGLEFKRRGNEGTRWLIVHCFQNTAVLLYSIVQSTQLFFSTLECRHLEDHLHVRLVDKTWTIIVRC